ncbi:hypothetical protein BpHYR1_035297 [Brachionus plicatilis]|uniref:Uncharacterized protein n=1 Tax=Brachionus plicatilis TaxID=10195 RepID=A0A3M7RZT1_BRAPC|nr:hypothetical protein BpHYR1_035297 [Brachionus plicatilis]
MIDRCQSKSNLQSPVNCRKGLNFKAKIDLLEIAIRGISQVLSQVNDLINPYLTPINVTFIANSTHDIIGLNWAYLSTHK